MKWVRLRLLCESRRVTLGGLQRLLTSSDLFCACCVLLPQAEEFDALEEDDQYTYLEELAPRMTKM